MLWIVAATAAKRVVHVDLYEFAQFYRHYRLQGKLKVLDVESKPLQYLLPICR